MLNNILSKWAKFITSQTNRILHYRESTLINIKSWIIKDRLVSLLTTDVINNLITSWGNSWFSQHETFRYEKYEQNQVTFLSQNNFVLTTWYARVRAYHRRNLVQLNETDTNLLICVSGR